LLRHSQSGESPATHAPRYAWASRRARGCRCRHLQEGRWQRPATGPRAVCATAAAPHAPAGPAPICAQRRPQGYAGTIMPSGGGRAPSEFEVLLAAAFRDLDGADHQ